MSPTPELPSSLPLTWLCDFHVQVAPAIEVGDTGAGVRRIIPITGGQVLPGEVLSPGQSAASTPTSDAQALAGRILPGGADYQWVARGEAAQLDARYAIELKDGTLIYVVNTALRHAPAATTAKLMRGEPLSDAERQGVYFRCQPRFEVAAASPWAWLQNSQFVGTGVRLPTEVRMRFWRVG